MYDDSLHQLLHALVNSSILSISDIGCLITFLFLVLKVQVPPTWRRKPVPVKGIELERTDFQCEADGVPSPTYTWVDWEKRDATDKDQ